MEKIIKYKILAFVNLYNFDTKFDFIQDHMKKLWIYLCGTIVRAEHTITQPKNYF